MEYNSRARSYQMELIDGNELSFEEYRQTLQQIASLNQMTSSYQIVIRAIQKHARLNLGSPLRVLDVGFGYGDTLRSLAMWSEQSGVAVDLSGIDLHPWAKEVAEQVTPRKFRIRYTTGNIFDRSLIRSGAYDVILSSLVTHHLSDRKVVKFIEWMSSEAKRLWIISDLHRHPIPFYCIRWFTQAWSYNRIIQNDAPLSVARSFRSSDWYAYLREAGVPSDCVDIRWRWPFRICLSCDTIRLRTQYGS